MGSLTVIIVSEKNLAARDGAKLVKNSGRGHEKGDAKLDPFLIDYKETPKSFTVNYAAWKKHSKDAWENHHREPVIVVELDEETLAVVNWYLLKQMRLAYNYVDNCDLWADAMEMDERG